MNPQQKHPNMIRTERLIRIRSIVCCSAIGLVLGSTVSVRAVDIVTRRSDNVTLRGELTKSDTSEVVLKKTNGEEVTVSVADLKSVQFDGEPLNLNQARSNERSGAFDSALEKLAEVQSSYTGSDKRLQTELQFLTARVQGLQALIDSSKADAAIDALEKFRTANKTNFRYLEATLLQAAVHAVKKEADAGKALLSEVQSSPVRGFQLQAGVDLGRLLLESGDAAGALAAFDGVVQKSQGDDSALAAHYDGMLGRALCLQKQNQHDDALKTLDEIIEKASQSETRILADAWNRKGDSLRQKNDIKAALVAYLHVDVLYPGEAVQHAEALLRLSQLWGPCGHEDRAVEASAKLAERYPNTVWAKQKSGS
ncbi:MAG: tetratricopeptide repeat protein [Planctomycetaceae bacterium]|nr:tetratricopeptide repeat protein [Planctomycetaceae bacterium]